MLFALDVGNKSHREIAAYSVVVKNVSPYTVYGGNPAKFMKDRFDAELKDLLLRFRWWDLAPEQLVDILPLLCDPDLIKLKQSLDHRKERSFTMSDKGFTNQVMGKAKKLVGEMTGDKHLETEGVLDQVVGKSKEVVSTARDVLEEVAEKVQNNMDKQ